MGTKIPDVANEALRDLALRDLALHPALRLIHVRFGASYVAGHLLLQGLCTALFPQQ